MYRLNIIAFSFLSLSSSTRGFISSKSAMDKTVKPNKPIQHSKTTLRSPPKITRSSRPAPSTQPPTANRHTQANKLNAPSSRPCANFLLHSFHCLPARSPATHPAHTSPRRRVAGGRCLAASLITLQRMEEALYVGHALKMVRA
ncbi:hypothetical protein IWZ03DRAFT_41012 [Phyllosticta citriasiana]|uniref:Uncharacterized protein n=1 Tax=Phyllosticta citriasiana TaxID=595635 RepID=A0ABR1KFN3_9PEZI